MAVLGGVLFVKSPAKAEEAAAYLEYTVDAGCPPRSAFVDQVRARSPRVRFADQAGHLWVFKIEVAVQNGRASGRMSSRRGQETGVPRTVDADQCSDVVSALALITALAIDAQKPEPAPAERTPEPVIPKATRPPTSSEADAAPAGTAHPSRPPEHDATARALAPREAQSSIAVGAHATAAMWSGSQPVFLAGGSAFLEGAWQVDAIWAPALRLSLEIAGSSTVRPAIGAARFTLATGQVDACPMRWPFGRSTWIRPCVALQAGRLTGTGLPDSQLAVTQGTSGPWWAIVQLVRLHAGLGGRWIFELEGGMAEPIVRDAFVFRDPDVNIVRVPRVVPTLQAGVALEFR